MADFPTQNPVHELIGNTALALDAEAFDDFLGLCTTDFHYRIRVTSPELGQDMVWLEQTREELGKLFAALPEHLTRLGRLTRQVSVASTAQASGSLHVTSTLSVFHTDTDGRTAVMAVGRYQDEVVVVDHNVLRLRRREVQLDTRDLGIGSHVPL
jgi:3-phenylpropionate/cinnamic acid dioxygenase small subunit